MKNMKKYFSLKDASDFLGLKQSKLRSAVFNREISYSKLNRLIRFSLEDLEEYMNSHRVLRQGGIS